MNHNRANLVGNSADCQEIHVVKEALFPAKFPNQREVSLLFIKNILYCNLDHTYAATKEILVHHKRKLERYSFKDLFKSDQVLITHSDVKSRVLFGPVSRLISIITALLSSVRDEEDRRRWSNLCVQLLSKELPPHSHFQSEVFIAPSVRKHTLPENIRQSRFECIMAPDKDDLSLVEGSSDTITGANLRGRSSGRGSRGTKRSVRRGDNSGGSGGCGGSGDGGCENSGSIGGNIERNSGIGNSGGGVGEGTSRGSSDFGGLSINGGSNSRRSSGGDGGNGDGGPIGRGGSLGDSMVSPGGNNKRNSRGSSANRRSSSVGSGGRVSSSGSRSSGSRATSGARGSRNSRGSRGSRGSKGGSLDSGRTVWEADGLQLMSDDIARLVGLDVKTVHELNDKRVFAQSLPSVSSSELAELRGCSSKSDNAAAVTAAAARIIVTSSALQVVNQTEVTSAYDTSSTIRNETAAETSTTTSEDTTGDGRAQKKQRKT